MHPAEIMEAHAQALMNIPSGEQFIAHIQSVVSIALSDIARWMKANDRVQPIKTRAKNRLKPIGTERR